jgi:hypothetical protein
MPRAATLRALEVIAREGWHEGDTERLSAELDCWPGAVIYAREIWTYLPWGRVRALLDGRDWRVGLAQCEATRLRQEAQSRARESAAA